MKIKLVYFIPALVWFVIANILFLMPGEDVPSYSFFDEIYFDKWVHAGLFGGLIFLLAYGLIKSGRLTKKLLIKISITCVLYGVFIEFLQKYVAIDRDYDVNDMMADTAGCAIGYVAAMWLQRRFAKNKPL
jgi:VanZ family protein